jgi:S-DNA-T family DNA segregation ATPase FtsK/SpoIIIE
MDGLKETFLAGGMIGKSMHELLFYELFGSSSTLIYIGIILVSFSIASSASWKNIVGAILKSRPLKERASKVLTEKAKPEIISSKTSASRETSSSEKASKTRETKKQEKQRNQKSKTSLKKNKAVTSLRQD